MQCPSPQPAPLALTTTSPLQEHVRPAPQDTSAPQRQRPQWLVLQVHVYGRFTCIYMYMCDPVIYQQYIFVATVKIIGPYSLYRLLGRLILTNVVWLICMQKL